MKATVDRYRKAVGFALALDSVCDSNHRQVLALAGLSIDDSGLLVTVQHAEGVSQVRRSAVGSPPQHRFDS